MSPESIVGKNVDIIARSLDLMSLRHKIIVGNIANAETPNYKAFDLVLMDAMGSEMEPLVPMVTPAGATPARFEADGPRALLVNEKPTNYRNDGNTVDIDKEMTKLAHNNISYNAAVQALSKLLSVIKYAIEEGGK